MATKTEGRYPGDFLKSEANGTLSRDNATVTVAAATKLTPGTVLGKITASGKYVPYDDSASDGREVAEAVLYGECDNESGGAPADFDAVVVNTNAEVRASALVWGEGVDDDGGLVDLAANNIKARD
jgi:hypothetical protein